MEHLITRLESFFYPIPRGYFAKSGESGNRNAEMPYGKVNTFYTPIRFT